MQTRVHGPLNSEVHLLGVNFYALSSLELLDYIGEVIHQGNQCVILSGNIHSFNLAYENPWLRDFMNEADLIRLDGFGIRIAAFLLGKTTPPRSTWADFGWRLAERASEQGFTLYFLGSKPGVAEKAVNVLQQSLPKLRIVGYHHGYFDKSSTHIDTVRIIEDINRVQPNILILGMGMPVQERWLAENRSKLAVNVVMTGGAVFDYLSGEAQRAPKWMTDYGLEWLGRMLLEPGRLWRRYLVGGPTFVGRVLRQRIGWQKR